MKTIADMELDGYAMSGLAVGGDGRGDVSGLSRRWSPFCPKTKPRYLMGVGTQRIFWSR